jgi:hypothetical protein
LLAQTGIGALHRAKQPLPFPVYRFLARGFLSAIGMKDRNDNIQYIFAHLYLLLCWNTMTRSVNAATIPLNHLEWFNDSFKVYIFQQKNDQEGDKSEHAKHVFCKSSNPRNMSTTWPRHFYDDC